MIQNSLRKFWQFCRLMFRTWVVGALCPWAFEEPSELAPQRESQDNPFSRFHRTAMDARSALAYDRLFIDHMRQQMLMFNTSNPMLQALQEQAQISANLPRPEILARLEDAHLDLAMPFRPKE